MCVLYLARKTHGMRFARESETNERLGGNSYFARGLLAPCLVATAVCYNSRSIDMLCDGAVYNWCCFLLSVFCFSVVPLTAPCRPDTLIRRDWSDKNSPALCVLSSRILCRRWFVGVYHIIRVVQNNTSREANFKAELIDRGKRANAERCIYGNM